MSEKHPKYWVFFMFSRLCLYKYVYVIHSIPGYKGGVIHGYFKNCCVYKRAYHHALCAGACAQRTASGEFDQGGGSSWSVSRTACAERNRSGVLLPTSRPGAGEVQAFRRGATPSGRGLQQRRGVFLQSV